MRKFLFLLLLVLSISACSKQASNIISGSKNLSIGTFNMEWLGDGIKDQKERTENDYKNLADIIKKTDFDIIGLQEVENEAALKKVLNYLPDYKFIIGKGGHLQNVAMIYKNYINLEAMGEYIPLAVDPSKNRPGLLAKVNYDNYDFYIMSVHLKSTSRFDDTPQKKMESYQMRKKQAQVLSSWVDSLLQNGKEKDIIIVGDLNDTPLKDKNCYIMDLYNNTNVKFVTAELKSCKNPKWYVIDHVILSNESMNRFIKGSEVIYNFRESLTEEESKNISDHCPVGVRLQLGLPDND